MSGLVKMTITPNTVVACSRCRRRTKFKRATAWNLTMRMGAIAGFLCPSCQTPEENAEAEINAATTIYGQDAFGRITGTTKGATA